MQTTHSAAVPAGGLLVCLVLVFIAQFAMDSWADGNALVHWIQHGLLFAGGMGTGVSLLLLRSRGQTRA